MAQKPSLGRVVIVKNFHCNGHDEQPAVITYVHGNAVIGPDIWKVNLVVLPDQGTPQPIAETFLFATRAEGETWAAVYSEAMFAFWPDRV